MNSSVYEQKYSSICSCFFLFMFTKLTITYTWTHLYIHIKKPCEVAFFWILTNRLYDNAGGSILTSEHMQTDISL